MLKNKLNIFQRLHSLINTNLQRAGIDDLAGHNALISAISPSGVFIDLGANKGRYYSCITQRFGLSGFAVEAEPTLFAQLPTDDGVRVYNYAIGRQNGFVELFLSNECEANSMNRSIASNWGVTGTVSVPAITLEKFITDEKIMLPIDIVKIDIEGAETDVIDTIPCDILREIKQIPMEFHDFLITTPEYKVSVNEAIKKLRQNGFLLIRFSPYDYRAVLAVNRRFVRLSFIQTFRLRIVHPGLRGAIYLHTWLKHLFDAVN
jgi:FkbM family methyltransferase